MAKTQPSSSTSQPLLAPNTHQEQEQEQDQDQEEEFIDMEMTSLPSTKEEFEFQMAPPSSSSLPSHLSADELFYKGQLLPLHLPPRLQMVQNILQNTQKEPLQKLEEPSCRGSCDISDPDGDECFFEWSSEANGFIISENPRKFQSWCKKLKKSHLGQRIRSLFNKKCLNKNGNYHFGHVNGVVEENGIVSSSQRRSFSGAIKWSSCGSSSTASSSSSFGDLNLVIKRSSSADSELESFIEGAIAHCKQSSSSCLVHERLSVK